MKTTEKYHTLLNFILKNGVLEPDPNRKNINRLGIPFYNMQFDLSEEFPIINTKQMWMHGIVGETINCLRGPMDLQYLHDNSIKIWDGDLLGLDYTPHIYGDVWRNWKNPDGTTKDQLIEIIERIKTEPKSSDLIIFGDNPSTWKKGVIKSCMNMMQFSVFNGKLHLSINYRSWDVFLGAPWNISQYPLVLEIIAKIVGLEPGILNIKAQNVHIYEPHIEAVKKQLSRDCFKYKSTKLLFSPTFNDIIKNSLSIDDVFNNLNIDMFSLDNYKSYPLIKQKMLAYSN